MAETLRDLIAHSAPEEGGPPQTLYDHAKNVAEMAAEFAAPFDSEAFARWLGWWHDAGKAHPDIQAYLQGKGESKDHSSVGMLEAAEDFQLLAHNIAGHHGGLANQQDLKDRIRRKREEARIIEALDIAQPLIRERAPSLGPDHLPAFLQNAQSEKEAKRRYDFWLRMLHSALVDADCLDTERHFNPEQFAERSADVSLEELWERFDADQQALLDGADDTPVNRRRQAVYEAAVERATDSPGFFSMTVPTGGGKTRSAMAFGLQHALAHGKRRVVVALPYTSIIEQNADVYRAIFGDGVVLEHHSAVRERANPDVQPDAESVERWRRLAAQNWDAPVVVTTTVQLLESLFANHNGRLRKLHRLAESVVVLDEVQTLLPRLLEATLDGLGELVEHYGATVLLCTATQPALTARPDAPDFPGLEDVTEIVPDPTALYRDLKRVTYDVQVDAPWTWDDVAEALLDERQAMAVLNTIDDAAAVLDALPDDDATLHLSTRLCGAHRRRVLAEVRRRLDAGKPIRLVATQVVEAGVDISFPRVLRALGPLDSIIQAAGRCNREGERDTGQVTVFEPAEGGTPPGAYRTGRDITRQLFTHAPDLDLHDPQWPRRYFERLYDSRNLDADDVQQLRAEFQFATVAERYRLIADDTTPVVVDYGEGWDILDDVVTKAEHASFVHREGWRRLQPYTVSLYEHALEEATRQGHARELIPDLGLWRWDGGYDSGSLHTGGIQGGRGLHADGPSAGTLIV